MYTINKSFADFRQIAKIFRLNVLSNGFLSTDKAKTEIFPTYE